MCVRVCARVWVRVRVRDCVRVCGLLWYVAVWCVEMLLRVGLVGLFGLVLLCVVVCGSGCVWCRVSFVVGVV